MRFYTLFALCLATACALAQEQPNPMTLLQKQQAAGSQLYRNGIVTTNPPAASVRTAAQWEEMQGVLVAWNNYDSNLYPLLAQIVNYAQHAATVYIVCNDSNSVKSYLTGSNVIVTNAAFVQIPSNSIWARDFGPNTVYENEVNNLSLVDWKYNRATRPKDDSVPRKLGAYMGLDVYSTLAAPNRLVHTGGNFMCDGHGTAFSSKLVLNENGTGGGWNQNMSEADVDSVMRRYMGINRYIKMDTLPYDGIHHIDMHIKLLDEETLLVGQYPTGVADGPQIEANLQYVSNNFQDCYGRPYKIIRIPQPPMQNGSWPSDGGDYLTYTNALILNNLVLVPSYYMQYDTTAQRIWRDAMPGYEIHFLDCNDIIQYSGAIHCITHEIGVSDPIFISHAHLLDTWQTTGTYAVDAYVNTASGVNGAALHWTVDTTAGYSVVDMDDLGNGNYEALIPAQVPGTHVFYYLEAGSNSGRTARKPLVAPAGVYTFKVLEALDASVASDDVQFFQPYPVPANDRLNVSFYLKKASAVQLTLTDIAGHKLQTIALDRLERGVHQYGFDVAALPAGNYLLRLNDDNGTALVKQISVAR